MLRRAEYDVAEVSLSSYLVARDQGLPFTAIPVFPRRLFSQSQIYVNRQADIHSPRDLVGKRIGLHSYQTTVSVLAKGDLRHEYGVPWTEVRWVTFADEIIPFRLPKEVVVERAPAGSTSDTMLVDGELQGLIRPYPPPSILGEDPRVGRLFSDPREEEIRFFRKNGYYPIMHVVAMKEEMFQKYPWVARAALEAFEKANALCHRYYDDPNWSRLAWGRHFFEEEHRLFEGEPWANGVAKNRANIERFIMYSHEQGLISRRMPVERLFAESTLDS
jgi:4,5-dihydroxyphthalate decarboxylase